MNALKAHSALRLGSKMLHILFGKTHDYESWQADDLWYKFTCPFDHLVT